MELKKIKKGDPIIRTEDKREIGWATEDGIQITVEPHEIAQFKRCFFVTSTQLVNTMQLGRWAAVIQVEGRKPK